MTTNSHGFAEFFLQNHQKISAKPLFPVPRKALCLKCLSQAFGLFIPVSHKTDLKAVIRYLFALFRALEIFVRVEIGEKGIRAAVGIHFRDEHFFAVGQKRPIDALSADDVNILASALFHLLFQSVKIPYDDTVVPYLSPGKYDIDAIFKRLAAREKSEGYFLPSPPSSRSSFHEKTSYPGG